jgi:ferredoxin-type protein NapH
MSGPTSGDSDSALFSELHANRAVHPTVQAHHSQSPAQKAALAATLLGTALFVIALIRPDLIQPDLAGGWPALLLVVGLVGGGSLLMHHTRYSGTEAGIHNDGVMFRSLASRGSLGWLVGLLLTAFYCALYWWDDSWGASPLAGGIALVDPLAQLLTGKPADRWFLYGSGYTLAAIVMGARMAWRYRQSRYHLIRTGSVVFFQLALAFLLPNLLKHANQPEFYFTYFWPLKPEYLLPFSVGWTLDGGAIGRAMILWAAIASFVAVPLLTWRFGKRWYCSWVCGCGGLAETLGDPWRHLSDSSTRAWKIERWTIHLVLAAIVLITGGLWIHEAMGRPLWSDGGQTIYYKSYGFFIGALFSGVVGVGFYPLLGSRVWCRFGCPQAAFLGIVQRFFSRFRITTNGGQCISCGNCSTYCEMGIDVRAYAQRGDNIVRASCVGCGVCASVCPRGVLKLETGPVSDRFDGADQPLFEMLRSMGVLRRDVDPKHPGTDEVG